MAAEWASQHPHVSLNVFFLNVFLMKRDEFNRIAARIGFVRTMIDRHFVALGRCVWGDGCFEGWEVWGIDFHIENNFWVPVGLLGCGDDSAGGELEKMGDQISSWWWIFRSKFLEVVWDLHTISTRGWMGVVLSQSHPVSVSYIFKHDEGCEVSNEG